MVGLVRDISRRMGLGPAALRYYHQPLARLGHLIAEGGPRQQRRTEAGRQGMIAAARALPPLVAPDGGRTLEVAFLSGERYWWQTLFCVVSLQTHAPGRVAPTIFDDGTFTTETWAAIAHVVPWARLVTAEEIAARLDSALPVARFPVLRDRRLSYPHLRKLTDIHAGGEGWRAVLDSDMLFFRPPQALTDWLAAPDRPCCLTEAVSAYGYSPALMRELAGAEPPARVNVGICGLKSDTIDWDRLEHWCGAMLAREGTNYLQEQALTALLLTAQDCLRLGPPDYLVKPSLNEGRQPAASLHHYVASSKRSYFQYGWQLSLLNSANSNPD